MNVAIIPARGGSKRIPGKNVKEFAGKPIIAYAVDAAKQTGIFDRIMVTTDSQKIADVAEQHGAEVPFLRPADLSDDHTPTAPVIAHAVDWLRKNGEDVDYACCIYATAAFVRPIYIKQGYDIITENRVSSVFSVTTFAFPIFRSLKRTESGHLAMFWPEHELTRSNDLPEAYHDAAQFYWVEVDRFMKAPRLYTDDAMPVILPRYLVQDIDTPEDWETAEYMFKVLQQTRK